MRLERQRKGGLTLAWSLVVVRLRKRDNTHAYRTNTLYTRRNLAIFAVRALSSYSRHNNSLICRAAPGRRRCHLSLHKR